MTEGRKIAALAETRHKSFAPHRIGPVGFAAATHASFSQPNTLIQGSMRAFYRGLYTELVTTVPKIEGGYVYPTEVPGHGVQLLPQILDRPDLTLQQVKVSRMPR